MKKTLLLLILICWGAAFIHAQGVTDNLMKFRYHNRDTILSRESIFFWSKSGQIPVYLEWENTSFALCKSTIRGTGLFTNTSGSFTTGQDVGLLFIKVGTSGKFIKDYYQSNAGYFVNDSQTPNVTVVSTSQGLMMQAISDIYPNTEIVASFQSIIAMFPNDPTVKFVVK
jgi:hypothetical protein